MGISAATYRLHGDGNLQASIGSTLSRIKAAFRKAGRRLSFKQIVHRPEQASGDLPDISGVWIGYTLDQNNALVESSRLTLEQYGAMVRGSAERRSSNGIRRFEYEGRLSSGQLVMLFEDINARGYLVGSSVLHLSSTLRSLTGKHTYYHHDSHSVMATDQIYKKHIPGEAMP